MKIVLTPNPNWYGDVMPTLTEIHMSMSPEPAQAQAAYEAGEIDMNFVPSEDVTRVKSDPVLGAEYQELPQLSITYYTYNNGNDPTGKKPLARCVDPKACPTANKNFRIALTEAVTRLSDREDPVPDAIWAEAARHYDEKGLAALILAIAGINVWNRLNASVGQVAGEWRG
jgi:ABC-type transport system substrate-binding protein